MLDCGSLFVGLAYMEKFGQHKIRKLPSHSSTSLISPEPALYLPSTANCCPTTLESPQHLLSPHFIRLSFKSTGHVAPERTNPAVFIKELCPEIGSTIHPKTYSNPALDIDRHIGCARTVVPITNLCRGSICIPHPRILWLHWLSGVSFFHRLLQGILRFLQVIYNYLGSNRHSSCRVLTSHETM